MYGTFGDRLHDNQPLQLDHFLTSKTFEHHVHQCCSYHPPEAIDSDHHPVMLKICLEKIVISCDKVKEL